jgi:hypothetical protein
MNDVSTNALNVAAGLRTGAMTRNDGGTDMRTARGFYIYCDTRGAAQRLGVSPRTLADYRSRGGGPKWVRIARAVRYRADWLDQWADEKAVTSTSQETARTRG